MKNRHASGWKPLTLKQEHSIRKSLLTGLKGWKFPLEEGIECQEKGRMPFYDTVDMANHAMLELLRLKAKVAKFHAEKAEEYSDKFVAEADEGYRTDEIWD